MASFNLFLGSKPWQSVVVPILASAALLYAVYPAQPSSKLVIKKGISSLPSSALKKRAQEIYPEDLHGEGGYAKLPSGKVKYWLLGPEDGKKVVLIHGLTIPSIVFREVAQILASHGFRVLLYDLYGRGYTDAPEVPYTAELYITQTALLFQYIGWEKAYVAGLSMGGAITAAFASTFPKLVDGKVAFIASAGAMRPASFSLSTKLYTSPIGRLVVNSFVWKNIRSLSRPSVSIVASDPTSHIAEIVALQSKLLSGYAPAIASSVVDGPLRNQEGAFKNIGATLTDVKLIWGTKDNTVAPHYATVLKNYMPQADILMIPGAGHDLTVTHAKEVGEALAKFFS